MRTERNTSASYTLPCKHAYINTLRFQMSVCVRM